MFCSQCGENNHEEGKFCTKCGTRLIESGAPRMPDGRSAEVTDTGSDDFTDELATGTTIMMPGAEGKARYEILGKLGHGGMGIVYKVRDLRLGRLVALKRLKLRNPSKRNMKRLLSEAKVLAGLRHHNICQIYDIGQDDNGWYISMEHLDGGTLSDLIDEKGKIDPSETIRIIRALADGLHHAHQEGVVHRDIKPKNVIFRQGSEPVLTDFGIAKAGESDFTMTGAAMGSPYFMAPEQSQDAKHVDLRADIYALGGTMYKMLTNQYPISINSSLIPSNLRRIVRKCLEQEPDQRYENCEALIAALDRVSGTGKSKAAKKAIGTSWGTVGVAVLALLAVVLAGTAVHLAGRQQPGIQPVKESKSMPLPDPNLTAEPVVEKPHKVKPAIQKPDPEPEFKLPPEPVIREGTVAVSAERGTVVTAVNIKTGEREALGRIPSSGRLSGNVEEGTYKLISTRADYYPVTNVVTVLGPGPFAVRPAFVPMPASMIVQSSIPASIWMDKIKLGNTGRTINNMQPGTHDITLKSDGYGNVQLKVTLKPNSLEQIKAPGMKEILRSVEVTVSMSTAYSKFSGRLPSKGRIRINDDKWKTVTFPYSFSHSVRTDPAVDLEIDGYTLTRTGDAKRYIFIASPGKASVTVNTSVAGAAIYRDGTRVARAGENIPVTPFIPYSFEVRAPGRVPQVVKISALKPGQKRSVRAAALAMKTASLRISTTTPKQYRGSLEMLVEVDGKSYGMQDLPFTIASLPIGEHSVRVSHREWKHHDARKVTLVQDKTGRVVFTLTPVSSALTITVKPNAATVFVNGKKVISHTMQVMPWQKYEIEASMEGYKSADRTVMPRLGESVEVKLLLKKNRKRPSSPTFVRPF